MAIIVSGLLQAALVTAVVYAIWWVNRGAKILVTMIGLVVLGMIWEAGCAIYSRRFR